MSPSLPPSIALYISAANQNATQSVKDCFTEDAVVKDEGKTFHGIEEIQQWMADAYAKYHHTTEPLSIQHEGQTTIVTSRLTGAFPGSPIEVPFRFVLRSSKIARLDIG
jgi:ketosteroid isomerase-like protein